MHLGEPAIGLNQIIEHTKIGSRSGEEDSFLGFFLISGKGHFQKGIT